MQCWCIALLICISIPVQDALAALPVPAKLQRRSFYGPLSELAGTNYVVDSITSPGDMRLRPLEASQSSLGADSSQPVVTPGFSAATCAVSFSQPSLKSSRPTKRQVVGDKPEALEAQNLDQGGLSTTSLSMESHRRVNKRDLTNQIFLSDRERSALFMTQAADHCVQAMRKATKQQGNIALAGVVSCYSLGYVDLTSSTYGAYLSVFRIGNVTELGQTSNVSLEELSQDAALQMVFPTSKQSARQNLIVESTQSGALDFKHPPIAPSDDVEHLINPTNPHYTASCVGNEMVLIATFHLNLALSSLPRSSIVRRGDVVGLQGTSPTTTQLVGRGTEGIPAYFFDVTPGTFMERSDLIHDSKWGLFKRTLAVSKSGQFFADSSCRNYGLSPNPFFVVPENEGKPGIDMPTTPQVNVPISPQANGPISPQANVPISPQANVRTPLQGNVPPPPRTEVRISQNNLVAETPSVPPSTFTPVNPSQVTQTSPAPSPTPTTFQLPGRTLIVLPIGLGIFSAVSLITVLFVAFVTYERTRYRQKFWKRKGRENIANSAGFMTERN